MVDTATRHRVTRNSAGLLLARVASAGAGLVCLPIVYGQLGAEQFGAWVLLSGVAAAFVLADLGLAAALVRDVARAAGGEQMPRLGALLGVGLVWGMGLAVLAGVLAATAWPLLARLLHLGGLAIAAGHAMAWLAAGLLAGGVELPWRALLEGTQRYDAVAWIAGGTALVGAGLGVLAVRAGGLNLLAAASAATAVLRCALTIGVARRLAPGNPPRPLAIRWSDVRYAAGYGSRVQASNAAALVNTELDGLLLGGFFGPAVAGSFDLGTRLLNLLRLPPAFVLVTLFPVAVDGAGRHGGAWLDRFYLRTTAAVTTFVAPGAAMLVVCADPLVRLWLGHPVQWAAANLAILAPCYAFNLAAGAATIVTRAEGHPGRETRYVLLSVVVNLALTVPLLHLIGPLGVPLATAIAVVVSTGYFVAHFHRASARPIAAAVRAVWRPIAAAGLAATAGLLVAGELPDGPGRVGAALAVGCRAGVVLLVAGMVLVLLRPPAVAR